MAQAGGTAIYQQEGTEAGASGDDLGAPFSLPVLSKSALTHHPQAGGGTACGSRAFGRGCPADVHSFMAGLWPLCLFFAGQIRSRRFPVF